MSEVMSSADGTPSLLDLEEVLTAIPGDDPCGPDMRGDGSENAPFHAFRRRFAEAKVRERETIQHALGSGWGLADTLGSTLTEWSTVLDMGVALLRDRSKDLHVAASVVEALVRLHGFAGLRDGLELAARLVETCWDDLHPRTDDPAGRIEPLSGWHGDGPSLRPLIWRVPLLPAGIGYGEYCQKYGAPAGAGMAPAGPAIPAAVAALAAQGGPEFYARLQADIAACHAALRHLNRALEDRLGYPAGPAIEDALKTVHGAVETFARLVPEADAEAATIRTQPC